MKRALPIVLLAVGLAVFAGLTRWQTIEQTPIIQTDGQGYYAYLPAIFIYHDLQFAFVDSVNERYYSPDKQAAFINHTPEGTVNKYFVGTAVAQAPFFLLARIYSKLTDGVNDGYAKPFQLAVCVAAIFYLCLGLWFLSGFLLSIGFKRTPVFLTSALVVFATNLLYYTIYEPAMSHVFSFCTVSGFLFFADRAFNGAQAKSLLGLGSMFALTVLIRPTNGIILLALPAVASGSFNVLSAFEGILKYRVVLLSSIALTAAILFIQPLIYFVQTGQFLVYSYSEEGFNFLNPEVYNVLFSYRKGLFVYAPILFISVLGILAGLKRERERYSWLLLLLGVSTWVISSWWMWYYGGCFGQRSFIEYFPFFAIGLCYMLQYGWGLVRPSLVVLIGIALTVVSMVQTYQYVANILPFDRLTKEKYWNLFLLTRQDVAWYYYPGDAVYTAQDSVLLVHSMEENLGWGNEDLITDSVAKNGVRSAQMTPEKGFGPTLIKAVNEIPLVATWVRIGGWVMTDSLQTDLSFVLSIEDSTGTAYFWKKYVLAPQIDGRNSWSWAEAVFKCGHQRSFKDRFVIFPMKSDGATVFIDDMEVSFIHADQ